LLSTHLGLEHGEDSMNEPLFPSSDEMDRRIAAAKQLRSVYLHQLAENASNRFSAQTRFSRSLEAMAAITVLAAGVFWLGVLSTPKITKAGQPHIVKQVRVPSCCP
jgi:hypothetical protein